MVQEPRTKVLSKQRGRARGSLRQRVLGFVSALVLLSLLGSTISLYRITSVNRSLDAINRVSIPLGRLLTQMQSDAEVLKREAERRLSYSHWKDPHWRARPMPPWLNELIQGEVDRANALIKKDVPWANTEERGRWTKWAADLASEFVLLRQESAELLAAMERKDEEPVARLHSQWSNRLEEWIHRLQWGVNEYDRSLRQTFSQAESRVAEARVGLEVILIAVVSLSLLLIWFGERTLRPLGELTRLARDITRRGLRKEDKIQLPLDPVRNDEVSQLAREFHHMATALLEREKTVEMQKSRLEIQNSLLSEMGELNSNILSSIKSILLVADLGGRVTQCNPVAAGWLGAPMERILGSELLSWEKLRTFFPSGKVEATAAAIRLEPRTLEKRVFGGHLMPLLSENLGGGKKIRGAILVLEDVTEELDIQDRLRRAENLAAVGRMSAQVAHEVRNPLHSIGLEAEMAIELAARSSDPAVKQSLQSILAAVDRLEKITENYLKLSRLSAGEKRKIDLGDVLESVLATYASACEEQSVRVDWSRETNSVLAVLGDRALLEQVLGNLVRNSLQAMQEVAEPRIRIKLGNAETGGVWLSIEDNGPGIAADVRDRLFTPFVTTKAQGTGLGLSFVKKVIEDHGGSVRCVERPAGHGACFEIVLPGMKDLGLMAKFEENCHV